MRRRVGLFLFCGLVLPLTLAAHAHAQGAVLELTPSSGPPGTVVNVVGSGFNGSSATTAPGVQLRLSTRDADPMKTAQVSTQNTITDSFPIPNVPPGEYLVLGTQTSIRGAHLFGTPGRAKLRVTAGRAAAAAVPPARTTSQATVAVGGVLVALILLAGATIATRRRTSHAPLGS